MNEVKWIKIYTNIFDNRKIRQLEVLPEGDTLIVIWFKLLCLAGSINDNGYVYFTKEIPYTEQMLSSYFGSSLTTTQLALQTFQRFNMIEIIDDILKISNWEKYQNIEGMDKIREQTRIRNIAYRERKKAKQDCTKIERDVTRHATMTQCDALDIDKELELKESIINNTKEKKKKNPGKAQKVDDVEKLINDFTNDIVTIGLLNDWLEIRKKKRSPNTAHAISLNLDKLTEFSKQANLSINDYLREIIRRGWVAFYQLPNYSNNNYSNNTITKPNERITKFDV